MFQNPYLNHNHICKGESSVFFFGKFVQPNDKKGLANPTKRFLIF
jgi:formylmethanofuran dehydrogenase subunit E-like metal-binding protein